MTIKPRVIRPNGKIIRVSNLGWLIRKARRVSIQEFRVYRAAWTANWQCHIIIKFTDGHIFACRYASYAVLSRWLYQSRTLPNVDDTVRLGWWTFSKPIYGVK